MPVSVPIIYWQWGKSKKKSNLTCIDMISQKIQKWNWAVWPRKQQNIYYFKTWPRNYKGQFSIVTSMILSKVK